MEELQYNHQRGNIPASMSKIPLFVRLKSDTLEKVLEHASVVHLNAGEIFLTEGGQMSGLYILLNGKFDVFKNGKHVASMNQAGELIGEMSFILNQPHQAMVKAATDASVFRIDPEVMSALPIEHYEHFQSVIYRYLTELLAERLARTSAQLTRTESQDVYYL